MTIETATPSSIETLAGMFDTLVDHVAARVLHLMSENLDARFEMFLESADFEEIQMNDNAEILETTELGNIRNEGGKWHKRRGRNPKPQRTPEEIVAIRAERAAKKARLAMEEANAKA